MYAGEKMKQKEKKKEEKIKCYYPGCNTKPTHTFLVPSSENEEESIELPFCEYHWFIVAGNHFKAETLKNIDASENCKYELVGPTETIEITEQVIGAIKLMEQKAKKE